MFITRSIPLGGKASLHQVSLIPGILWPRFHAVLDCNLVLPLNLDKRASLILHMRDVSDKPRVPRCDFIISGLQRWRFPAGEFQSFDHMLSKMNHKHYHSFIKTWEQFEHSGSRIEIYERDWSKHADAAYRLYENVAKKHTVKLFDLEGFRAMAARGDHHLIACWLGNKMVGCGVIIEEPPILHAQCLGLDYTNSSQNHCYSIIQYETIRYAIKRRFRTLDVGPSAGAAKLALGFKSVDCQIDVYGQGFFSREALRLLRLFFKAEIDSQDSFHLKMRRP